MRRILLSLLIIFPCIYANAKIKRIKPNNVFEGDTVRVAGTKFSSKNNLLKAILVDGSGEQFGSDLEVNKKPAGFTFVAPEVARTRTLILRITGGNVDNGTPDDFPLVIFNAPDLSSPDPSPPEEDLEVENLVASSIIFNNTNLSGSTQGNLLWSGKTIANSQGDLLGTRLTIDDFSLEVDNGVLTWNSHPVITDAGVLSSGQLNSINNKTGKLQLDGNGDITFDTTAADTIIENSSQGGTLTLPPSGQVVSVLRAEFDQAVDGGSTGSRDLRNATLPANARVTRTWYEVLTTFTSATDASSIGISIPSDDVNGLLAPIAISDSSNPWDQGAHAGIQSGLLTNISEKTSAKRNIQLTIAGEALSAGKVVVFIEYMLLP